MEKKYLSRDVIGKQVIDTQAMMVGKVKDFSFDMVSKNITLIVATPSGEDKTIDGNDITTVGDVILLGKQAATPIPATSIISPAPKPQPTPQPAPQPIPQPITQPANTPGLCSNCGYQNDATAKFCIKCGTKLK